MLVKVEPSGCSERKGKVQVRFSMYLEKGDYGYEKMHVEVPVVPADGLKSYKGKLNEDGTPASFEEFTKWIAGLPKIWQDNPFHNHFIQVPADLSEEEIMDIGEAFLHEAYIKWATGAPLDLNNAALAFKEKPIEPAIVQAKVQAVKRIAVERKI